MTASRTKKKIGVNAKKTITTKAVPPSADNREDLTKPELSSCCLASSIAIHNEAPPSGMARVTPVSARELNPRASVWIPEFS